MGKPEIVLGGGTHSFFEQIISLENLFGAWQEFKKGKMRKFDVQAFGWNLEEHVFALYDDLRDGNYRHGPYESFYVHDPKRRHIHKPSVRDRLLHHALFRVIEPLFDRRFIFDSWSCRKGKGAHRAVDHFQAFGWQLSRNNTRTVWVLKLDIQKFFQSVDQEILFLILTRIITDPRARELLKIVIKSFPQGIPLGNLTSQLFANIYLNELDQFVKHELRMRPYVRYCDDFVLLHHDRCVLEAVLSKIQTFLSHKLHLALHPKKIILTRYHQGVDFLGFVCFPHYRILRTKTKRRLIRRLTSKNTPSYSGLLKQVRAYQLKKALGILG